MSWMLRIVILLSLAYSSVLDIKKREVSLTPVMVIAVSGWADRILSDRNELLGILAALLPGILALLIAKVSRESIGYGDGWLLLALGLGRSGEEMAAVIGIAVCAAGICALLLCVLFRKNGTYKMPFVPFLLLGYLIS